MLSRNDIIIPQEASEIFSEDDVFSVEEFHRMIENPIRASFAFNESTDVWRLLFYDGFTDSLDGGQLIVLHDALSILLFESAIDLM